MPLFSKKKESNVEEVSYEIFGGFIITKNESGYEIKWKNPIPSTITVPFEPIIDANVKTSREENTIRVLSTECKLTLIKKKEGTETKISQLWGFS